MIQVLLVQTSDLTLSSYCNVVLNVVLWPDKAHFSNVGLDVAKVSDPPNFLQFTTLCRTNDNVEMNVASM